MLQLKNITKNYITGDFKQTALDNISIEFREKEFVSILGASGSGKTTLLNIIGGLDRYDSGDLVINSKSTKQFRDKDWDAYRNNSVGFIFQSYNLITHVSVLENVEMCMTLSGVSSKEKKDRAIKVLEEVGLKEHIHKKPNQLSGGQMQRVAIARALVNDPDIILADEPTGALDSSTSLQIMELIKKISNDKLVIMVTHNPELASKYSSRIIEIKDGDLLSDSNPVENETNNKEYNIKKTSMSFLTALKLSFTNIWTKKGRTLLTAFASSIGIIGIAVILALSNGFDKQIDIFETDTLSSFPIMITSQSANIDKDAIAEHQKEMMNTDTSNVDESKLYTFDSMAEKVSHTNKITGDYIDFIEKLDAKDVYGINYTRALNLNLLNKTSDKTKIVKSSDISFTEIPKSLGENENKYIEDNYKIVSGKFPTDKTELVIITDGKNRINNSLLDILGIPHDKETIEYDEIIGKELKLVLNNDFYQEIGNYFTLKQDLEEMYDNENNLTLKIVGVAKASKEEVSMMEGSAIAYTSKLSNYVLDIEKDSKIAVKQKEAEYNVLTGEKFDLTNKEGKQAKDMLLMAFGATDTPVAINIFPTGFEAKSNIIEKLDKYNENLTSEDKIVYTDLAETIVSLSGDIMDSITVVLIAFSAISLVVSSIMIGIITYISVLERTKEIGILRALGARKKDITRVFNAETFLIGITSGLFGVGIAALLTIPINIVLEYMTNIKNIAMLNPIHALLLVAISVILSVIAGYIPAKVAAKKDPVEALRTE